MGHYSGNYINLPRTYVKAKCTNICTYCYEDIIGCKRCTFIRGIQREKKMFKQLKFRHN